MYEFIEFLKDTSKYIIIIVIIILARVYLLTTTQVVGPSMEANLKDGNILLVDQISHKFKDYNRFDIVVFRSSSSYLVKRVIGLPGDKVKYTNNKLYINGSVIENPKEVNGITSDFSETIVPENEYFVLGDNRENSVDSRNFGCIKAKNIIGSPFIRVWPLNEIKIVK